MAVGGLYAGYFLATFAAVLWMGFSEGSDAARTFAQVSVVVAGTLHFLGQIVGVLQGFPIFPEVQSLQGMEIFFWIGDFAHGACLGAVATAWALAPTETAVLYVSCILIMLAQCLCFYKTRKLLTPSSTTLTAVTVATVKRPQSQLPFLAQVALSS